MNLDPVSAEKKLFLWLERDAYRERMFLKGVILVFTAWFLGTFLWVTLQRIGYPFELEAHEGISVEAALRLLKGFSLYTVPSIKWVPLQHTPLYYYIGAGLISIFGVSLTVLRVLTFCSALGIGFILYKFLRRTGVEDFFALAGLGLYFSAFAALNSSYDLARIDMTAIFFSLLAVYFGGSRLEPQAALLSAIFIALSIFTKQCYIIIWVLLGVHWYLQNRRLFWHYIIASLSVMALGFLYLHFQTGGTFWNWVFAEPWRGELRFSKIFTFWFTDLFGKFPLMTALAGVALFGLGRIYFRRQVKLSDSAMAVLVAGFILVSLLHRVMSYDLEHSLIPALLALAGLASWALQHFHVNEYSFGWLPAVAVKVLIIVQFGVLLYSPGPLIPGNADYEGGRNFIKRVSEIPGNVLIPNHPYYCRMAGKSSHFSALSLRELVPARAKFSQSLPTDIRQAISERDYSAVIIDQPLDVWVDIIAPYYFRSEEISGKVGVFMPRSGLQSRPQYIYLPQTKREGD